MGGIYAALLRGINVGGRNKLPMKELVGIFEKEGCDEVRTYIQSGNVVFRAPAGTIDAVAAAVRDGIARRFGFDVPIILRSASDLARVAAANPFLVDAPNPKHLHVGFLADAPRPDAIAALDAARSDVDRFAVVGSEVYLHVPGGMGRTKLTTDWFDRRLETAMTVRNWRTVNTLVEMTGAAR